MNDLGRFMESPEGLARLAQYRTAFVGRTIVSVQFINDVHTITVVLEFLDGTRQSFTDPQFDVDEIRAGYGGVLRRMRRHEELLARGDNLPENALPG
jgi:hypothetical protein